MLRYCLTIGILLASQALTNAEPENPTFVWLDSLGFEEIKSGDFIKLETWWVDGDGKRYADSAEYGFTKGNETPTTMVGVDLSNIKLGKPDFGEFAVSRIDFAEWMARHLEDVDASRKSVLKQYDQPYDPAELVILARAAAARGLLKLSEQALGIAGETPSLDQIVKVRIGDRKYSETLSDLNDPSLSRQEVVDRFDWYLNHFPGNSHAKQARQLREQLADLISQDAKRTRPSLKQIANLPQKQRIAELVYQLRNTFGQQVFHPGFPSVFEDRSAEPSIALQLLEIGAPAVPALFEASTDTRPTRGTGSSMHGPPRVISIRDAALEVISRIAGHSGWQFKEEELRKWWRHVQSVGYEEALIAEIERGDVESINKANALIDRAPDRVLKAILVALNRTKDPYVVSELLSSAYSLKAFRGNRQIQQIMLKGPNLSSRVRAASLVFRADPNFAVKSMIRELRNPKIDNENGFGELVSFLFSAGVAEAVDALRNYLSTRNADSRMDIIGGGYSNFEFEISHEDPPKSPYWLAVERLLVSQLSHIESRVGMSLTMGQDSLSDPRVCDLALLYLRIYFPKKYSMPHTESWRLADIFRVEAMNIWRRERGLPDLFPPVESYPFLSPSRVRKMLSEIARQEGSSRGAKLAELESLGLRAGPGLVQALKDPNLKEGLPEAMSLAKGAASIVREVKCESRGGPFPAHLLAEAKGLKGRQLSAETVSNFFERAKREWPGQMKRLELSARRDGDGYGYTVVLASVFAPYVLKQLGWKNGSEVHFDRGMRGMYGYSDDEAVNVEFRQALMEIFEFPPDKVLVLKHSLERKE
jgi:hypothetical protein